MGVYLLASWPSVYLKSSLLPVVLIRLRIWLYYIISRGPFANMQHIILFDGERISFNRDEKKEKKDYRY